jgi:hypothetical protein
MLYAKKMQNPLGYIAGVVGSASRLPGISEAESTIGNMMQAGQENTDLTKAGISIGGSLISSILARSILASGTLSNIDKGLDVQRQTQSDVVSKIIAGVPFLRRLNPVKINEFTGETLTNENIAILLLTGSRLKTATNDPVTNEIVRLDQNGTSPAVTSIAYVNPTIKEVKAQLSDEDFVKVLEYYGEQFHTKVEKLMVGRDYQKMPDMDAKGVYSKSDSINAIRKQSVIDAETYAKRFGYKKPMTK